jgi:selenocysteine lyase/cysteine desulfurase
MNPLQARDLFPIVHRHIFMNHAGTAPMSDRVRAALSSVVEEMTRHPAAPGLAAEASAHLRRSLGRLLEAPAETIAITRGGVDGLSLLAGGLRWRKGDSVVVHGDPGPWRSLPSRGVDVRRVADAPTPDAVLALVDESTRVVALDHVQLENGWRTDLEAIGRECDRRAVVLAVDASLSAGALRLDLSRLPVDLLTASGHRWLMGPAGIGFCYCRPELAKRLDGKALGESAPETVSVLDATAAAVAVDLLLEVGTVQVEERVLALGGNLATGLKERGYELVAPWPRAARETSAIVAFRRPGSSVHQVMRDLLVAGIVAQAKDGAVLLSPHFYNTEQEVTRVLDVLAPEGAALL